MSSIVFQKQDLESLLNHHINILKRFTNGNESTFSLIYFKAPKDFKNSDIFKKSLRSTDALFIDDNHYIAMLIGTDWNGALEVLSGIQSFFDDYKYDNIVCYPDDGKDGETLMNNLQDIIIDNYGIALDMLKIKS
ncbi:hypothetical protein [Campylobacter sputorum]|uniref:hypothetical protein n=1 Tax=Campylobacter sputorum TaxID=206 RepID=UPI00191492E0|nr:hypothetical protein [Campylobacter sputorum]ASM36640.1 hypothetical protein CSF_0757 [Campylobacter sputorum bv. faecalis CCUG 20703]